MTTTNIRILIADDHPLLRAGLRRVLDDEPGLAVVGEAQDGETAIRMALSLQPDVILMDVNLPGIDGFEATRRITASLETTDVIILTAFHHESQAIKATEAGAAAYFPKDVNPQTLIRALRAVYDGYAVVGGEVMPRSQAAARVLERLSAVDEGKSGVANPLTRREMDILQMIARGCSNKEIASHLHIRDQTVKNHLTAILQKLSLDDRTKAAMLAIRRGWVRLEDTGPLN